jgi:hypothetical protein
LWACHDRMQLKAFLRSFVKRVAADGNQLRVEYHIPLPSSKEKREQNQFCLLTTLGELGDSNPLPFGYQSRSTAS